MLCSKQHKRINFLDPVSSNSNSIIYYDKEINMNNPLKNLKIINLERNDKKRTLRQLGGSFLEKKSENNLIRININNFDENDDSLTEMPKIRRSEGIGFKDGKSKTGRFEVKVSMTTNNNPSDIEIHLKTNH